MWLNIFPILAIACSLTGISLYVRSIINGTTKPHLFSWLIWSLTMGIAFMAQIKNGGGYGAWPTAVGVGNCLVVCIMAWRYGDHRYRKSDWYLLLCTIAVIPFWLFTNSALGAVIWVTLIDFLGYLPSYRKAWHKPLEEKPLSYLLFSSQFSCAFLGLAEHNWITSLYPVVMALSSFAMLPLLLWRRQSLTKLQ